MSGNLMYLPLIRQASLLLLVLGTACAVADMVGLGNGDIISGKIVAVDAGIITVKTEYAGMLSIAQEAALYLVSDTFRGVQLADGTMIDGSLRIDGNDQIIDTQGGPLHVPLGQITALLPPGALPEEETVPMEVLDAAPEAPTKRWAGAVDAGLSLRSGNTDTLDLNFASKVTREGDRNTLTLDLLAAYGEADSILNTRRYRGEAKWQVYPGEQWYYYVLGAAEHDTGRKLKLRLNAAVGAGKDFIETEKRTLSADIGLDLTRERWDPFTPHERDLFKNARRAGGRESLNRLATGIASGTIVPGFGTIRTLITSLFDLRDPLRDVKSRNEEFVSVRLSSAYEQQLFKDSTLSDVLTLYANVEEIPEFRLTNDLAFATPLTDVLKLRVSLKSEYDSRAGESGVEAWDNSLLTSLRYEF